MTAADALRVLNTISPVASIGLDKHGRVDLWNPAAAEMLGWAESEVAGNPLPEALRALATCGTTARGEAMKIHARDGRELAVEARAGKRRAGGLVIAVTDVSGAATQERERLELMEREKE